MVIDKQTPFGGINISMDAIASVAGSAALECYGVVGMSSKNSIRENINDLLKKENFAKGVLAKKNRGGYEVDIYIIVAYGLKITEIVAEVQKKVKYVLEKTFDIKFKGINVYVQGIKVML